MGKLECPERGVLSGRHVLNCFLLCTCREEELFQVPWQHNTILTSALHGILGTSIHNAAFPSFQLCVQMFLFVQELKITPVHVQESPLTLMLVFPGSFVGEQDTEPERK